MAASVMASSSSIRLKPNFNVDKSGGGRGVPSLARVPSSFKVEAGSGKKKIKTDSPYGNCLHFFWKVGL